MSAVSVIMPVYNAEKYLKQSIDSVLGQLYQDWNLIIVNDGSQDKSEEICCSYASKDPRIVLITQKNAGPSTAIMNGLLRVQSEFVMFLDADDWYESEMIGTLLETAVQKEADSVMVGYQKVNENGEYLERPLNTPGAVYEKKDIVSNILVPFYEKDADIYRRWSAPRWNKIYRTSVLKKAFADIDIDMTLGEDLAMNLSFLNYANKVVTLQGQYLYNYRVLDESAAHGYSQKLEEKNQNLAGSIAKLAAKQGYTFAARNVMEDNNTLGLLYDLSKSSGMTIPEKMAVRKRLLKKLHRKQKALKLLLYYDFPGKSALQSIYRRLRN